MADPKSIATALFAAWPDAVSNPTGVAMRNALMSRLKGATPGSHSETFGGSGPSFLSLFFPSYAADANLAVANSGAPSLDDGWWSGFATVALCQVMLNLTSDLRGQLHTDDINNAVNSYNQQLQAQLLNIYGYFVQTKYDPVSTQFAQIGGGQASQVAQFYTSFLESPAWISAKVAQAGSRSWNYPAWELFHHWLKLKLLGVALTDINATVTNVANQFAQANYTIPAEVGAASWQSYRSFMNPVSITWGDLQGEAANGVMEQECSTVPGTRGGQSCMNEENSFEFTANGQPGSSYRSAPSHSCFLAGTQVLMADRTTKPIEAVAVGDKVMTRRGGAAVLAIAVLEDRRKTAYGLNRGSFRFTGTHPFVTVHDGAKQGPALACAEPLHTLRAVPTLSACGLAGLEPDGPSLLRYVDGRTEPYPVRSLETYGDQPHGTLIYDLVTEFDPHGASEYIAGDGETMLVVSSELPRYGEAPLATYVLSDMIDAAWPSVSATLKDVPADRRLDAIHAGIAVVATNLLADSVRDITGAAAKPLAAAAPQRADAAQLSSHARAMANAFMAPSSHAGGGVAYDRQKGALFAGLAAAIGHEFDDAISLGWRRFVLDSGKTPTLSLSVCTLALVDTTDVPSEEALSLLITLDAGGNAVARPTVPVRPTRDGAGHYRFNQLSTFDHWRAVKPESGNPSGRLSFKLRTADGAALPLTATTVMPSDISHGYRRFSAKVVDAAGRHAGELTYDLRTLDRASADAEAAALQRWTAADAHAFAHALGMRAGALMAERFPDAVKFGLGKFRLVP